MQPPRTETVEAWAWNLVHAETLAEKLDPPPPPRTWEDSPPSRRLARPGRPPELAVELRARRAPKPGALREPKGRASLFSILHHHELQAAELFAWALLAFPSAPGRFRRGLVALAREELAHARLYRGQVLQNDSDITEFPVRDWFWEHIPRCETPTAFVSLMGLGFEGGNLEHAERYASDLEAAGCLAGAEVCRRVAKDEESHVRFAARWFRRFEGELSFDLWRAALPEPLTPTVLKGARVAREARLRAGLNRRFIDELEGWSCARPGS